eukprot:9703323-Lingulodinium_polyedra.AAC.1
MEPARPRCYKGQRGDGRRCRCPPQRWRLCFTALVPGGCAPFRRITSWWLCSDALVPAGCAM